MDKELEEQNIRAATDDTPDDECEDFKGKNAPVKLPMEAGVRGLNAKKMAATVKQEVVVKSEPGDVTNGPPPITADVNKEIFEDEDVVKLLNNNKPTLILLQFPESLPGRGGVEEDSRRRREDATPSAEEPPDDDGCYLKDLEEGRMGKLLVHRSGRVSLSIGNTMFDVSMGTGLAHHAEAMSVAHDPAAGTASLAPLGGIAAKLLVVPQFEQMLRDMSF